MQGGQLNPLSLTRPSNLRIEVFNKLLKRAEFLACIYQISNGSCGLEVAFAGEVAGYLTQFYDPADCFQQRQSRPDDLLKVLPEIKNSENSSDNLVPVLLGISKGFE